MSKKVISILLSAAMLVAMLCVGVGAVTASADDTVTYYFLAPDDYFATNDSVGYYYWAPEENAAWPGLAMTPAPEVGKNVFKCECPDMDSTSTIIFNAFVDAGNPADPELAAVAHQTVNINTEGYMEGESETYDALGMELDDFYGMIFVLNNNDKTISDFSGAATTAGEWFSIDPSAVNYYKNFDKFYGSYNFSDDTDDTDVTPDTDVNTDTEKKQYHAGDVVEVSYNVGNVPNATCITASVYFNTDVLDYVEGDYTLPALQGSMSVNDSQVPNDLAHYQGPGELRVVNTYNIDGKEMYFAGEKVPVVTYKFTAKTDFNVEDMDLSFLTQEIGNMTDGQDLVVFDNFYWDPEVEKTNTFSSISYVITCNHEPETDSDVESDTDSNTDSETTSSRPSTDSDKPSDTDTTSSKPSTDSDKTTDSDKKDTNDNASSKKTSSTSTTSKSTTTTSNAATVQTAGTFAVVSLVVILMAAAAVVLYTRKKTEE